MDKVTIDGLRPSLVLRFHYGMKRTPDWGIVAERTRAVGGGQELTDFTAASASLAQFCHV